MRSVSGGVGCYSSVMSRECVPDKEKNNRMSPLLGDDVVIYVKEWLLSM